MASGLIARAGGSAQAALRETADALAKVPAVTGRGATAAPALDGEIIRVLADAEQNDKQAGVRYVTVKTPLPSLSLSKSAPGTASTNAGGDPMRIASGERVQL